MSSFANQHAGHALSCFVCTRGDLLSGDVARVLDLRRLEALFVDRIVFANVVASAVTVWGGGATKYAMGALKRSLHSCFFCYHRRTTALEEEGDFFHRRLGATHTLVELLALRRQYRRSFAFVIRCLPALVRLHLRTARDNRFPLAVVRGG